MTTADDAGFAAEFGLRPDLSPEQLRQVHRRLVRQYHPDLGGAAVQAELLARINAAYDALRLSAEKRADPAPTRPPNDVAEPEFRTVLELKGRTRRTMERMALAALDDWLEVRQGVPRSPVLRRLSCVTGLRRPIPRPGLHIPGVATLRSDALCLQFGGAVTDGPNIVILPGLRIGNGGRLEPTGGMRAILRTYSDGQPEAEMPPKDARRYGVGIRLRAAELPAKLLFDPDGFDAGHALCAKAGARYRGLFLQHGQSCSGG